VRKKGRWSFLKPFMIDPSRQRGLPPVSSPLILPILNENPYPMRHRLSRIKRVRKCPSVGSVSHESRVFWNEEVIILTGKAL
jgi:hypothetical protein